MYKKFIDATNGTVGVKIIEADEVVTLKGSFGSTSSIESRTIKEEKKIVFQGFFSKTGEVSEVILSTHCVAKILVSLMQKKNIKCGGLSFALLPKENEYRIFFPSVKGGDLIVVKLSDLKEALKDLLITKYEVDFIDWLKKEALQC